MIITNGKLITWVDDQPILRDRAIRIVCGKISEISGEEDLKQRFPEDSILDAKGQYVLPGNICAHTHFYGVFSRGMTIQGEAPKDFTEILEKLWWPLDRSLDHESVRYSAFVCIADAIRHGTTTMFDHHASANCIDNSLFTIYDVVKDSGIRASLCYEVSDRDGKEKALEGIEENKQFIEFVHNQKPLDGRIHALFGLHAAFTISDETFDFIRKANTTGAGYHIHVAEHPVDEFYNVNHYGLRVVDRLEEQGILGPKTIIAHGVHIDAKEMQLLADSGTWISHQPRSNMNNGVGMSDIDSMLRMGCKIAMGNDGFSNAMWQEWKTTYLAHKLWHMDPRRMNGTVVKNIAIDGNAALASSQFNQDIGYLREGAVADIIFVDYKPITPIHSGNLPWHILFGFRDSMVTMTMVAGEVLMKDRELLTIDEEEINYHTQKIVPQLWERYQAQFK